MRPAIKKDAGGSEAAANRRGKTSDVMVTIIVAEGGERLKRPTLHKKGKHCAFLFKLLQSNLVHCRRP